MAAKVRERTYERRDRWRESGLSLSLGFRRSEKDMADVDQVVGDNPKPDKTPHAIGSFVAAAMESMTSLQDADAAFTTGAPFLSLLEPTRSLTLLALRGKLSPLSRKLFGRASRDITEKGEQKRAVAYGKLLEISSRVAGQAKKFSAEIASKIKHGSRKVLQKAKRQLDEMVPRVEQVMRQTRQRVLHGDTRAEGKIVSVFEPQTEVIRRAKQASPMSLERIKAAIDIDGGLWGTLLAPGCPNRSSYSARTVLGRCIWTFCCGAATRVIF